MSNQLTIRKFTIAFFSAMVISMLSFPTQAIPITNGSFENVVGPVPAEILNTNLPGWSISGSSFLSCVVFNTATTNACGSTGQSAGAKLWADPGPSPDGGNFVLIDGDPGVSQTLSQTVSGLVAGQSYKVTFYQNAGQFQSFSGDTTEQWQVTLFGVTQFSDLMTNLSHGTLSSWQSQTLTFTAPSTTTGTEVLQFFAVGTPSGLPPVVLLDGVSITEVPEPETLAVLCLGLLGILVGRRCRLKRS